LLCAELSANQHHSRIVRIAHYLEAHFAFELNGSMVLAALNRLDAFEAVPLGVTGNMREQFPAYPQVLIILAYRECDLATFKKFIRSKRC
jgi:hypothetical protein